MKIRFVGTSSGKTSLNRFHSSLLLSSSDYNLLVDAGDGISRALLSQKIDFNSINGIIITHLHPDHFAGLSSLIIQMKLSNRKETLDLFVHQSLKDFIEYNLIQALVIPDRLKFKMRFRVFDIENPIQISKNFYCLAKENSHLSKLQQYEDKYPLLNLISSSLLFISEGKKIFYTSDIDTEEDLFLYPQIVPDLLIVDANHLNGSILVQAINKIKSGLIYLTHYSDEDIKKLDEILAMVNPDIQKQILIAQDGLSFEI